MYANDVENHSLNFSLSNDVKANCQHLDDIILKIRYQYFMRHIGGFVVLGVVHHEDTINNLLDRLLRQVDESQSGSKGLTESRKEGPLQVVSRDFLSQLTIKVLKSNCKL